MKEDRQKVWPVLRVVARGDGAGPWGCVLYLWLMYFFGPVTRSDHVYAACVYCRRKQKLGARRRMELCSPVRNTCGIGVSESVKFAELRPF